MQESPIFFFVATQAPDWQVWPAAQTAQVRPLFPQAFTVVPALQPFELQHPLGHVAALQASWQTPTEQLVALAGHALHAAALLPQTERLCAENGRHLPLSQQPLGQLLMLHVLVVLH